MGKSTKAETANRLRDVAKLMVAGAEFAEIRQFASERQWGISDRSIRRYMEKAYKRMAEASKRDSKQLLGRHLMQRRALYARCLKQGDHRTALSVLKDEADLQGVYPQRMSTIRRATARRVGPFPRYPAKNGSCEPSPPSRRKIRSNCGCWSRPTRSAVTVSPIFISPS